MDDFIEIIPSEEDRYTRLVQAGLRAEILRSARVLVIGAGALGNEVVKNLTLLGVGSIYIVDFDRVEESNLSRSVFFHESDIGRQKAKVVAYRARELNPDVHVGWFHGDVIWSFGTGCYRRFDVVMGCLDNRAARLAVNLACFRVGTPWIDGGIDQGNGRVRLFGSSVPPCFECMMDDGDYNELYQRFSCTGAPRLTSDALIPTTPISTSIIAAMQVQECIRYLHDRALRKGIEIVYTSDPPTLLTVKLHSREDCPAHEISQPLIELASATAEKTTIGELLDITEQHLGEGVTLELDYEVVTAFVCPSCFRIEQWIGPLFGKNAFCPHCSAERIPVSSHRINRSSPFLDKALLEIGIPRGQIIRAKRKSEIRYFELGGDLPSALQFTLKRDNRDEDKL